MTHRRLSTWTGAALGCFAAVLLNAAIARGSDKDAPVTEEFHQTYPLAANGRVELQNINGAVHISTWDQNQVKVDAIKRAYDQEELKQEEIRIDSHPESISIETKYHQHDEGWRHSDHRGAEVEYTLTVPRTARLDEIKLINGALDVTNAKAEVRASCINGKLTARGLAGDVSLSTINGPLEADFNEIAKSIELSSINGPVHLTLPSDAKASIEATTIHGGIDNNFGLHINNHRWVGHDLRGELGGGGAHIRLKNINGTIDVRHADDGHAVSPAKDAGDRDKEDEI
jgi:Putative adhesin